MNISHVLFKSAYIHDVAAIAEKARSVGAVTIVDGYQSVGTIPVDVQALGVDVYIGGCLKWLCGGPGAAFLWVEPGLRPRLRPALTGWMSHERPFAFEPCWPGATTPGGSSTGRRTSRPCTRPGRDSRSSAASASPPSARSRCARRPGLLALADDHGFRCTTPREPERRGGTVAIEVDHGYETSRSLKARASSAITAPGRASGSPPTSTPGTKSSTRRSRRSRRSSRRARGGSSRGHNRR